MKIVLFCHSILSDWNHGNAHFLRGIVTELKLRGHQVEVYEPLQGWSFSNLIQEPNAEKALQEFQLVYPEIHFHQYSLDSLDIDEALEDADLVIVHEWNDHDLVRRVGRHRAQHPGYRLLFHDTHHRAVTQKSSMSEYDLSHYDGVLAFGNVLRDIYLEEGWAENAWTWHEAADVRVFRTFQTVRKEGDLIWIGNWGDHERAAELMEFLIQPVRELQLKARIHGVRYPEEALAALAEARIHCGGWIPNFKAPAALAAFRLTVHVPRRPYVEALPGIPTIRMFEALACGIPLICSPWDDVENLFTPDKDYLIARNGGEMKRHLRALLNDKSMAREIAEHGRRTILERHTCAHRVDELLDIYAELAGSLAGQEERT